MDRVGLRRGHALDLRALGFPHQRPLSLDSLSVSTGKTPINRIRKA